MRTLFLAWQAPDSRAWYPVGRLDANTSHPDFIFQYTHGALTAQRDGFHTISAFPELHRRYESTELFPLFQNRIIAHRRGFAEYVQSLDMDVNNVDPLDILAITGGERQTDSFEVFPKLVKNPQNSFHCRFFLHGIRYCASTARNRALSLQPGEELRISIELNNPATTLALQLSTQDYEFVGWSPRYLVNDLLKATSEYSQLKAKVIRNNNEVGTPMNRTVLIELSGVLPTDYEPMSSEDFAIIAPTNEIAH